MSRRLPPLNALKAFEAAARHGSFTRAADELNVTQGAVSHQVKALEARLGLPLFERGSRGLAITAAGRAYLDVLRDAFDRIAAGTERVLDRHGAGTLTVSTSPNFAAKWLVPRLGRFAAAHPALALRLSTVDRHVDFACEDVDVAIRRGEGAWPGLHAIRLRAETLFPVCSPVLLRGSHGLRHPAALRHHLLLHVEDRAAWSAWLGTAGLQGLRPVHGPVFDGASLAIDAAASGQGVALGRSALVAADLLAGRLVCPFGPALPIPAAYWIVCPKPRAGLPKIVAFRDWILDEAAAEDCALAGGMP